MAKLLQRTAVSPERFRNNFSLQPLAFWTLGNPSLFDPAIECNRPWSKYDYQQPDQASRQNLAETLRDAEEAVANFVGYRPAPTWLEDVIVPFPKIYGKWHTSNGKNFTGHNASVYADVGWVIDGGIRGTTLMGADLPLAYDDVDGDGWDEMAAVVVTKPVTPDIIPASQVVKIFHSGYGGDTRSEIREVKLVAEDATTWTFRIDSWLLVDPELYEAFPMRTGFEPIDATAPENFVLTVDAYWEFNDFTSPPGTLIWEEQESEPVFQPAFLEVKDRVNGLIIPHPARYDIDNDVWVETSYSRPYTPDRVQMNLYAGKFANDYLLNLTRDPLDDILAQAISYIAAARTNRDICACNNDVVETLRDDLGFISPEGNFLAIADALQDSFFGSRKGEFRGYKLLENVTKRYGVALL